MKFIENMHDRPTVVVATGIMNAGGTETLIMEMLRHASGRVRYVMLIHYDGEKTKGVFDDEIRSLGIEMQYIPSAGSLGMKGYIKAFGNFVTEFGSKIDVVHCHLNGSGGIISLAAKRAGIKHVICHCHADIHYTGGRMARWVNEIKLCVMKSLIDVYATDRWACSVAAWKRLFMPWRKRVVINNMIDTRRYLSDTEKKILAKRKFGLEGKRIVGAVGRVAPIKNYETIIHAIKGTDSHFVCFGRFDATDVYCKSLIALADNLGVSDQVHWMGNSNNVAEDIHCIDIFVMPSFTEGFGMAALEAQAAGLPTLLSTGVPGMIDVGLGLVKFIEPKNIDAWHEALLCETVTKDISSEEILGRSRDKGFDSPSAVKDIEDKYISIARK